MELDSPAPARKVVSRSPAKTVRRINLPAIFDAPIECESSLERDFVLRAALCPSVTRLRHQPFRLSQLGGRHYTPDFLATSIDGSRFVVEVKLAERVPDYRSVFDQARDELAKHQIRFLVLTEAQIRHDRIHERAAMLLRYRKSGIDGAVRKRLLGCTSEHPEGLAIDLLAQQSSAHRLDVLHLAATRQIRVSSSIAIEDNCPVFPINAEEFNHEVHLTNWFDAALW